jgi:hypothetical protein
LAYVRDEQAMLERPIVQLLALSRRMQGTRLENVCNTPTSILSLRRILVFSSLNIVEMGVAASDGDVLLADMNPLGTRDEPSGCVGSVLAIALTKE